MDATADNIKKLLAESARLRNENRRIRSKLAEDRAGRARDRTELDLTRQDLAGVINHRLTIEQAKGILAGQRNITTDDAYTALRTYARAHNQTIADVSNRIVDATNNASRRSTA